MAILFVDLDGTLYDSTLRFNMCLKDVNANSLRELKGEARRKFWDCFLSDKYMEFDVPIYDVIDFVRKAKKNGWNVVVLTGRTERQKDATLKQLYSAHVPFDAIVMRKVGDYRKDHEYKGSIISKFLSLDNDVMVIDDSEDVRQILPDKSYPPNSLPQLRSVPHKELTLPNIEDAVVVVNDNSAKELLSNNA